MVKKIKLLLLLLVLPISLWAMEQEGPSPCLSNELMVNLVKSTFEEKLQKNAFDFEESINGLEAEVKERMWGMVKEVFTRSARNVRSLMFGETQLASGGEDCTVKIWNPDTGKCLRILSGHSGAISSIAFSPKDGKQLASGSGDKTVRIWDLTKIECLKILKHECGVSSIAYSPDGNQLASAENNGAIRIWNPDAGKCLKIVEEERFKIEEPRRMKIAYLPCFFKGGYEKLISGGSDGVVVWYLSANLADAQTGYLAELEGHEGTISAIKCFSNGEQFVSGDSRGAIKIWDEKTNGHLQTLLDKPCVYSIACLPGGSYFVSGGGSGTIKIWDSASGKCLRTVAEADGMFRNFVIEAMESSPDGKQLATGSNSGKIKIWDLNVNLEDPEAKVECLRTLEGHEGKIYAVAYSPVISKEALSQEQMPRKSFEQKLLEYASESLKSSGGEKYAFAVKLFACSLFKSLKSSEQKKLWNSVLQQS